MHHTVAVRRRTRRPLALAAGSLLLAACSHDGRTLAPPRPDQTTTTAAPTVLGSDAAGAATFALAADGTEDGGALPVDATCFGDATSPALSWTNVPTDAAELALVVRDRDADGFVHWIVTGIDPSTAGFEAGSVPEGAVEQVNTTGAIGWFAPCPPTGDDRHVYDLVLHVLPKPIAVDPGAPAAEVAQQVEDASTEEAPIALTVTPPAQGVGSTG